MNSLRLKESKNIGIVGLSGMVKVLRLGVRFGSNMGQTFLTSPVWDFLICEVGGNIIYLI